MILVGDIGGTKTNLALFDEGEGSYVYSHLATYQSQRYPNLIALVQEFLNTYMSAPAKSMLHTACFAIAGPIFDGMCRATNLPWVIDSAELASSLNLTHVYLLNDLEANAWAIEIMTQEDLWELYLGQG